MPFTLDQVVPWGRSFDEYRKMFSLSDSDLNLRILACADGPASFNCEATRRGCNVVSCDPLYEFERDEIEDRFDSIYDTMIKETRCNKEEFVWEYHKSVEQLANARKAAMKLFLEDFEDGKQEGRYVEAELPTLPFGDQSFCLALCSHFLFLYTDLLSEEFHYEAILEMCRVAAEARIFPLHALGSVPSRHLKAVTNRLEEAGYAVTLEPVNYEFQKGADKMMRIRS